jgi:hypothetical protein
MRDDHTTRLSAARSMTAAITFDVDGLQRDPFHREPSAREREALMDLSHEVVLPRIADWLLANDVKATFFSIGGDVERRPQAYRRLADEGHEIANHSHRHLRAFSREPASVIRSEIRDAHSAILAHTGQAAAGFRAPGYTVSPAVIRELEDAGYAYDASMLPSWSYSALKQAFRWLGGSAYRDYLVVQSYACAAAPRLPYPVSPVDIYRAAGQSSVFEVPITTLGPLQLPFIYGVTFRFPLWARRMALAASVRRPFFTLSFHDLEFADQNDFGSLPCSSMTAPHLRSSIGRRLDELSEAIRIIKLTHRFATVRDSIAAFASP